MIELHGQSPNIQAPLMIEERLLNIETKITFQEDMVEELNKVVYQQQKKLDRLEAMCESLVRHLESLAEERNVGMPLNERPPHY
jgi:SlyX protein